jgi:Kef-type K+ transport system membrane component KefB
VHRGSKAQEFAMNFGSHPVLIVMAIAVISSLLGEIRVGVRVASRGAAGQVFREKMEAIAFGFFIPFFFVVSGVDVNLGALLHDPKTLLLVPVFLVLFLIVRECAGVLVP